jgi:hypothetical protein
VAQVEYCGWRMIRTPIRGLGRAGMKIPRAFPWAQLGLGNLDLGLNAERLIGVQLKVMGQ